MGNSQSLGNHQSPGIAVAEAQVFVPQQHQQHVNQQQKQQPQAPKSDGRIKHLVDDLDESSIYKLDQVAAFRTTYGRTITLIDCAYKYFLKASQYGSLKIINFLVNHFSLVNLNPDVINAINNTTDSESVNFASGTDDDVNGNEDVDAKFKSSGIHRLLKLAIDNRSNKYVYFNVLLVFKSIIKYYNDADHCQNLAVLTTQYKLHDFFLVLLQEYKRREAIQYRGRRHMNVFNKYNIAINYNLVKNNQIYLYKRFESICPTSYRYGDFTPLICAIMADDFDLYKSLLGPMSSVSQVYDIRDNKQIRSNLYSSLLLQSDVKYMSAFLEQDKEEIINFDLITKQLLQDAINENRIDLLNLLIDYVNIAEYNFDDQNIIQRLLEDIDELTISLEQFDKCVDKFVQQGGSLNEKINRDRYSPLMLAINPYVSSEFIFEVLRILFRHGITLASLNHPTNYMTILLTTVTKLEEEVGELSNDQYKQLDFIITEYIALPGIKDSNTISSLLECVTSQFQYDLLFKYGARLNLQSSPSFDAILCNAARKVYDELLWNTLLNYYNVIGNDSLLPIALSHNNNIAVLFLLSYGAIISKSKDPELYHKFEKWYSSDFKLIKGFKISKFTSLLDVMMNDERMVNVLNNKNLSTANNVLSEFIINEEYLSLFERQSFRAYIRLEKCETLDNQLNIAVNDLLCKNVPFEITKKICSYLSTNELKTTL